MLNEKIKVMSPSEAGRIGGQKTAEKGIHYFKAIGRKGGKVTQKQRLQKITKDCELN